MKLRPPLSKPSSNVQQVLWPFVFLSVFYYHNFGGGETHPQSKISPAGPERLPLRPPGHHSQKVTFRSASPASLPPPTSFLPSFRRWRRRSRSMAGTDRCLRLAALRKEARCGRRRRPAGLARPAPKTRRGARWPDGDGVTAERNQLEWDGDEINGNDWRRKKSEEQAHQSTGELPLRQ